MCGRYTLKTDRRRLAECFELDEVPEYRPRYNLAPTQHGLVVRAGARPGTRAAAWIRWGLIPGWINARTGSPLLINARAETLATKPAFRNALHYRRCLVIADGFYGWSRHGTARLPHYITVARGEPFAMAGLWEGPRSTDAQGDDAAEGFAVITTAANGVLAPLFPRMPAILEPDVYEDWLNPLVTDTALLLPLLQPYPSVRTLYRTVSTRVNHVEHDDPECLRSPTLPPELTAASAGAEPEDERHRAVQLALPLEATGSL